MSTTSRSRFFDSNNSNDLHQSTTRARPISSTTSSTLYSNNNNNNVQFDADDNYNESSSLTTTTTTTNTNTTSSSNINNNNSLNNSSNSKYKQPISTKQQQHNNNNNSNSNNNNRSIVYKYTIAPILYLLRLVILPIVWLDVFIMSIFRGPVDMTYQTKGKIENKCRIISWVTLVSLVSLFAVYLLLVRPTPFDINTNNNTVIPPTKIDKEYLQQILHELLNSNNAKINKIIDEKMDLIKLAYMDEISGNNQKLIDVITQKIDYFKQKEHVPLFDKVNRLEEDVKLQSSVSIGKDINELFIQYKQDSATVYEKFLEQIKELARMEREQLSTNTKSFIDQLIAEKNTLIQQLQSQSKEKFESLIKDFESTTQSHTLQLISQLEKSQENEKDKLYSSLQEISLKINSIQQWIKDSPELQSLESSLITVEKIQSLIDNALEVYASDKTARLDYALRRGGASIQYGLVHHPNTETYPEITIPALLRVATQWIRSDHRPNVPEIILDQSRNLLGDCWAFKGQNGSIAIKLAQPIIVKAITIEHPNPKISYHFESALQEFSVVGVRNETDTGTHLGTFRFEKNNKHIQTFLINNEEVFPIVVLKVLSNFGYDYTCIYRTRVHGEPTSIYKDPVLSF
ncbi:SUN domain-containing protein 1 [Heterostelium album PN500]|uniref:SUN domain-containing protein 1 n=1 Tax=Heterostelium pallidum (strain ATCC 26659 / Pp 5 / PN500) TaxID=670386 RepID=D3B2Q5_HETP5|nr:SUN domain-containing protein 1 [Heterostelium album PN500]EFA83603.1 SUN domain-containing protein 1 [Heterostelium album PN500]|eukprot:XP_020435720.1 SUN domain-containing protein 1 [Heterostelium album PN500]